MSADLLNLLLGPPLVGGVIGAWIAAARLFALRLLPEKPRLPVWIPWAVAPPVMLAGFVYSAAQIITASTAAVQGPAAERGAAALMAVLLSPIWIGGAALAAIGIVLHYALDDGLARLRLDDDLYAGLALGLRAAWLVVGLLMLFLGLWVSYGAAMRGPGVLLDVTAAGSPARLLMVLAALVVTLLGMALPAVIEHAPSLRFSVEEDPASPPPPPPAPPRA